MTKSVSIEISKDKTNTVKISRKWVKDPCGRDHGGMLGKFTSDPKCPYIDRETGDLYTGEYGNDDELISIDAGMTPVIDRNSHKFWMPTNHLPFKESDWNHVPEETKKKVIEEYGSLEKASMFYAIEDWKRAESFGTDWDYVGCVVDVSVDSVQMGHDSLWGIESDSGEEHLRRIAKECVIEALHNAQETLDKIVGEHNAISKAIDMYLKEVRLSKSGFLEEMIGRR